MYRAMVPTNRSGKGESNLADKVTKMKVQVTNETIKMGPESASQ